MNLFLGIFIGTSFVLKKKGLLEATEKSGMQIYYLIHPFYLY